ncbi:ATP binding cassette (ABC) protein subfamily A member, partial [Diabrotica virgifera virgifera]|uniref:ATP-binding cassette sub-family A member 5-like n=1 Tax=Diabrotica virgifera virgifera TaxID=50390 RepID=A0A6P7GFU8_DIAVI
MITPFFDKASIAGSFSAFMLVAIGLLYCVQIFVSFKNHPEYLWALSLISPAGFGIAIDKVIMLDIKGEGVTMSNLWDDYDVGLAFGISLIILLVDIVLYGVLGYYLENVIPSKSCCLAGERPDTEEVNSFVFPCLQKFRKPNVVALDGINLSIYEGQITAILGHNGAGKTTLFNILTGLSSPSSGRAFIYGRDVRNTNDMNKIRKMTGICPQHDILFDNLTPREHLEFFAEIKGIPNIKAAVNRTIRQIDLVDKIDTKSKDLSGGQKRKLSVGIALIGDPKIIILDEPTSGVDPYSRRQLWNVLQEMRGNKLILLTTHFMDEADILADRKAVISKGKVRCVGSSLFLKNKFGVGYHLTLVLENNAREDSITRLVTQYVRTAKKDRRQGRELRYILPNNTVDNFSSLFSAIEYEINNRSNL